MKEIPRIHTEKLRGNPGKKQRHPAITRTVGELITRIHLYADTNHKLAQNCIEKAQLSARNRWETERITRQIWNEDPTMRTQLLQELEAGETKLLTFDTHSENTIAKNLLKEAWQEAEIQVAREVRSSIDWLLGGYKKAHVKQIPILLLKP